MTSVAAIGLAGGAGVFNHTGRRFFAFEDVIKNGSSSRYASWYFLEPGVSGYKDNFRYKAWEGHEGLPRLNHDNPEGSIFLGGETLSWVIFLARL